MAHDVFISHARRDKKIAEEICGQLELARLKCWIAPRDISAGEDWTKATRNAIESSRVMVLVFSDNANAAPHIEREIAHAFYTGKIIIAFRLTEAPPRRDFLFYLGDVCWLDAFNLPPERHLEALTMRINNAPPPRKAIKTIASAGISNSGRGELRISHSPAQGIFKRVAIVGSVAALPFALWFASRAAKEGLSTGDINLRSKYSDPSTSVDSQSESKPRYTFTRLGLWVPVNPGPTPFVQREAQDIASPMAPAQSANATTAPSSDIDQEAGVQPDVVATPSGVTVKSAQEDQTRVVDRRKGHRAKLKSRPRHHVARSEASKGLMFTRIKNWLIALLHER
jgi:hypothetical protein